VSTKLIIRFAIGGIAALALIVGLLCALLVNAIDSEPKTQCTGQCAFVSDVRETGKYADRTDIEIAEYGQQLCTTLKTGATGIVYALESEEIVESAIKNLCPEALK
jgi:hypothetical protein